MDSEPHIAFGPFRLGLEPPQAGLWRGVQAPPVAGTALGGPAVSGRVPRSPGDEGRAAPARLGRDACDSAPRQARQPKRMYSPYMTAKADCTSW